MDEELKKRLSKTADAIRQLSIEGVQKANSGHPGLPLGCAELGAYLYGVAMRHNPKNPHFVNRDRLILSAGHGSMWLYSCLHLAGFDLSLEELKRFRQLHSKTPGHPEFGETAGVESTTGPLGQGVGNAVGNALALKLAEGRFKNGLFDGKVYCLAGDGCLMEGVSQEASSLAGHLKLDNLVLFHDANHITLDGPLSQSSSENVPERYRAYGWDVFEIDGNDLDDIDAFFRTLNEGKQTKPIFVTAKTIIGKGSPNKAGSHKVHGSPLGEEELKLTKENLGLPTEEFYIPQVVLDHFSEKLKKDAEYEKEWNGKLEAWKQSNPEEGKVYDVMKEEALPDDIEDIIRNVEIEEPIAGRAASNAVLQVLGDKLPYLYGGSADLSGSDSTMMKQFDLVSPGDFHGRNIKYGVREFAMATIAAGLFQSHLITPYIGTFLTFSDYMRNAIRLAALSHYKVFYQFTHDSVFLGEDGPTHQPVEHYMTLRAIPNLHVFRPADRKEVKGAWLAMLRYTGPSAILLTRQKLPGIKGTCMMKTQQGAYIVKKEKSKADFTLFATGSELSLAMDVAAALEKVGKDVRVVSMVCWELFDKQPKEYQDEVLGGDIGKRVSIEAGIAQGWHRWIGPEGIAICMEGFGASAPQGDLANEFGFTVESVIERLL